MSRFRSLILIIGLLLIAVAAALLTVLVLYATGTIITDPIELVYSVGSDQKIYDGTPLTLSEDDYELVSGNILEGHTAEVKIIGSQTDAGISETTAEIKIYDKNGFDVSKEYAVKINAGTLTVDKKDLSVVIPDSDVYYSGKEVYFDNYEVDGELALGHKFVGLNTTLLNVGDYIPQDIKFLVYDAFGTSVTDNYNINCEVGNVKVVARPVTIKPVEVTRYYDGQTFTPTEYEITEGSLVEGQFANVEIATEAGGVPSAKNYTEMRIVVNERKFKIYADDGVTEVTGNYDLTFPTAFFKIEKRPLTVITDSDAFIYNGLAQSKNDYKIIAGDVAPKQTLQIDGFNSITDVGSITNSFTYKVLDADGEEVTGNYEVKTTFGTLTVKPLDITVYTKSYSKEYDGKPLSSVMGSDEKYRVVPALSSDLFKITYTVDSDVLNQKDAIAQTYYDIKDFKIENDNGDNLIELGNFNINYQSGQYSITKKSVTVQSPSATFVYNGAEQYVNDDGGYAAYGLAAGDSLQVNADSFTKVIFVTDSGTNLFEFDIVSNGDSVIDNYNISYNFGTLTVIKKEIEIQSPTKSFVYDGNEHSFTEGVTPAVVGNDVFAIVENSETKVKDVTAAEPNLFGYTITSAYGDVSDNYSIKFIPGTLSVTPKPLTVDLDNFDTIYDGTEFTVNSEDAIVSDLETLDVNDFIVAPYSEMKNAGTYYYTVEYKGESQNYSINAGTGTVKINPKQVALVWNDAEVSMTYHGYESYYDNDGLLIDGLSTADGHTIATATFNKSLTAITVTGVTLQDDLTSNYEVDCSGVEIIVDVKPCEITVVLPTITYDPYYVYEDFTEYISSSISVIGLAAGDVFTVKTIDTDESSYYRIADYELSHSEYYNITNLNAEGKIIYLPIS